MMMMMDDDGLLMMMRSERKEDTKVHVLNIIYVLKIMHMKYITTTFGRNKLKEYSKRRQVPTYSKRFDLLH